MLRNQQASGMFVDCLENMPKHDEEVVWYLDAFFMLSSSRAVGMGMGAIPLSEIIAYTNTFELLSCKKTFISVIQAMDNVYIKYTQDQKPKQKPKK